MSVKHIQDLIHSIHKRINSRQKSRHRVQQMFDKRKNPKGWLATRLKGIIDGLTKRIKKDHTEIKRLEKRLDAAQQQGNGSRDRTIDWETSQVGVAEGGTLQKAWAADLGYSWTLPWCSIFQGYALKHFGGFSGRLPTNPAYSGNWLTWEHGHRVSYGDAQPGDLLIFDWGDGGITDHVAMYVGNGLKIGGNENDRVEKDAVPVSNVVGVIRPNWKE